MKWGSNFVCTFFYREDSVFIRQSIKYVASNDLTTLVKNFNVQPPAS
jgi:hypothetical protein